MAAERGGGQQVESELGVLPVPRRQLPGRFDQGADPERIADGLLAEGVTQRQRVGPVMRREGVAADLGQQAGDEVDVALFPGGFGRAQEQSGAAGGVGSEGGGALERGGGGDDAAAAAGAAGGFLQVGRDGGVGPAAAAARCQACRSGSSVRTSASAACAACRAATSADW